MVEDSEDDALLLLRELRRGGYQPEHEIVETPEGMRAALAERSWDVILSDYRMPRFGAPEALGLAREAGSEAPFVVVSGKIGEDVAVEAIRAGAYDYVMKDGLARLCATVAHGLEETKARRELRRRDAILDAVRFAADQFLGEAVGWEESVRTVLRRLGEATGASRAYIFENHVSEDGEIWGTQRYEWVAEGIPAQTDSPLMQAIPYRAAGYGRWVEMLSRGEPVHGRTGSFPSGEQVELRAQGILSILIVPIFVEGRWWGQIGFDACREEREWSAAEVGALGAAAGTLGAAIRRRRIETRLTQSEGRYRAVIEQATDGIYLLDAGTRRFVETNPSFRKMFGYTVEEVGAMDIYALVAHDPDDVDATIERTLEQRRRVVGERRYRRRDGSLLDVEVGVSVISLDGRDVICTIVRDVTERKRAEERLRASEAELRALFEAMTDVIFVIDGEGRHLEVAPTNPSLLYRSSSEIVGKTLHEIFPKEQADEFLGHVRRVLETRRSVDFEYALTMDHGRTWFEGTVSPMLEESVIWVARDVTRRKRDEEALRESERLHRAVLEQASENIFLVDVETRRIVDSNRAFRETLGYTEEGLHRLTLYDVVAADRESVDANIRRILERGSPSVGERRYVRKDGSLLEVEVSGSVILRDGKRTLVAVAHDITERARAQRLLEERVSTLSGIAANLTLDLPVENTLDVLAKSVVGASTAVACAVALLDEGTGTLRMEASWRAGVESPTMRAVRTGEPVIVRGVRRSVLEDERYAAAHGLVRESPWDIVYIVPLVSRGRTLGAIDFGYLPGHEPGEEEKVFLGAAADQAAVAVENARLFSEARGKAALEERQKLARELHDSVSQALYGIALGVQTARELLESDPRSAAAPLDYAVALAEAGMTEMRALIFELRPESLENEGLVAALEKQAAAVEARHGLRVDTALDGEPEAPLETREALYRIAQEALHNVVKHARASRVRLTLEHACGWIALEVSDDGSGFDPDGPFPGHLGLRSMRERAWRLGGTLDLQSGPGRGTRVVARVPSG
nr:PAS domain S-box protein [Rubrobacter marinus]